MKIPSSKIEDTLVALEDRGFLKNIYSADQLPDFRLGASLRAPQRVKVRRVERKSKMSLRMREILTISLRLQTFCCNSLWVVLTLFLISSTSFNLSSIRFKFSSLSFNGISLRSWSYSIQVILTAASLFFLCIYVFSYVFGT